MHAEIMPRCHGEVAMADAILALTANMAMDETQRIEFEDDVVRGRHARRARDQVRQDVA